MPKWLDIAKLLVGTHEAAGSADNPLIIEWAKKFGGWTASFYQHDEIPWCGLFTAHCLQEAGVAPPKDFLAAKSFAAWGDEMDHGIPGAILVFGRVGGGHVGFYVSEDDDAYHVLGGNQSDSVCLSRIAKTRCLSIRWPSGESKPWFSGPVVCEFNAELSKNEA